MGAYLTSFCSAGIGRFLPRGRRDAVAPCVLANAWTNNASKMWMIRPTLLHPLDRDSEPFAMSLLSDMGPSIFAATIAAAASAMVGIDLNGDGVVAKLGHGNERLSNEFERQSLN